MAKTVQLKAAMKSIAVNTPDPSDIRLLATSDTVPFGYLTTNLLRTTIQSNADADTCIRTGMIVTVGSGGTNFPPGDTNGGVLMVLGHSENYLMQIFSKCGLAFPALYMRTRQNGVWTDWQKFTTEYERHSTQSVGYATDLDGTTTPGRYKSSPKSTAGHPSVLGVCVLEVMRIDSATIMQRLTQVDGAKIMARYQFAGDWKPWWLFSGTKWEEPST